MPICHMARSSFVHKFREPFPKKFVWQLKAKVSTAVFFYNGSIYAAAKLLAYWPMVANC